MASILPTGTDIQIATDSAYQSLVVNSSGSYAVSRDFVKGDLPYAVNLYARIRHTHPQAGTSEWSPSITFSVITPASIIGVCLDNTDTTKKGVFYWIDAAGNKKDSFDWTAHPTFAAIVMATIDDARAPVTMTKLPLFFVKTAASGPAGSFAAGKKCWWISDLLDTGFRPAACFKRSTVLDAKNKYTISPFCYIGTYLAHQETVGGATCVGSKKTQTVLTGQTKSSFKTYISNRNNAAAGISGFRMFDIWDLSALRLLLLVATANSDSQTVWGDNAATAAPKTGATNAHAIFKGTQAAPSVLIDDLWKCFYSYVDLITTAATGVTTIISPMDLTTTISFGTAEAARYTQPVTTGWLRDILDCPMVIGDDTHDLMELFLPKTIVAAEVQASFSDAFLQNDAAGDIFWGGSFNYTETYQNYEQTGSTSTTKTHYSAGTDCGHRRGDGYCGVWWDLSFDPNSGVEETNGSCSESNCQRFGQYTTVYTPIYGYVTRTRAKAYTTEPGLFSLAKGVPFPTYNATIYGCRLCKN